MDKVKEDESLLSFKSQFIYSVMKTKIVCLVKEDIALLIETNCILAKIQRVWSEDRSELKLAAISITHLDLRLQQSSSF